MNTLDLSQSNYINYDIALKTGEQDSPGSSNDNNEQKTNGLYYLNDTHVEHVQIQDMDKFLSVNYFPRDIGYFLQPESVITTNQQNVFFPNKLEIQSGDTKIPLEFEYTEHVKEGLQYLNILQTTKANEEFSEFVNSNQITPLNYENIEFITEKNNALLTERYEETVVIDDDEDDVIFVQEYKLDKKCITNPSNAIKEDDEVVEEVVKRRRTKKVIEPRRNPKRQVQLQKASYDLAIKLSLSEYPKRTTGKENTVTSGKRTCRKTGAVFSPPRPFNTLDFKEWPTEGMHERPKYNTKTQKLEKFDYDYVPTSKPKKSVVRAKRTTRRKFHGKRKNSKEENGDTKFAQLTHETLLLLIDYIKSVKISNHLILQHQDKASEDALTEEDAQKSLDGAKDILSDTAILYCLANNVSQKDLAHFLESLVKDKDKVN